MNKAKKEKMLKKDNFGIDFSFQFRKKYLSFYFLLFTLFICFSSPSFAQEEQSQITAPPPLKTLSKAEKTELKAEPNVKKHTKLALELIDARLTKAENLNNQQQYTEMFDELGGFHALVDDTLDYLNKHDTDSGKVLNNFKRLEMSLRQFAPRIELIRRDVPSKYEPYLRTLIVYLREARTKAVEPLFTNSILPDSDKKNLDEN